MYNMRNVIPFWKFPKKEVYILLNKQCRKSLIENAIEGTSSKNYYDLALILNKASKKYNLKRKFNGGDIKRWLDGENKDSRTNIIHPKFIPLWAVVELKRHTKIKLEVLEKEIIGYKSGTRGKIISNPKLPIRINPEFDSLIIHLFADGYVNNKISSPSYCQKNEGDRELFINKLKNSFGDFKGTLVENKVIRFPKVITRILSNHYNIPSYMSKEAVIPKEILDKNKKYKLACIIAFILDEGNIKDCICCFSTNKIMLSQIRQLFQDCGYECNPIRDSSKVSWFGMKNRFVNEFYRDIIKFKELYPNCSLGTKNERLHRLFLKPRRFQRI